MFCNYCQRPGIAFRISVALFSAAAIVAAGNGCVTKKAAKEQARLAYLAGQRDAIAQMNQKKAEATSVTFIGPVSNAVVPWTEGLTLGKAILTAVYNSPTDPALIIIRRSGEELEIDPKRLLSGDDFPLKPGDVVQFRLAEQ